MAGNVGVVRVQRDGNVLKPSQAAPKIRTTGVGQKSAELLRQAEKDMLGQHGAGFTFEDVLEIRVLAGKEGELSITRGRRKGLRKCLVVAALSQKGDNFLSKQLSRINLGRRG